MSVTGSPVPSAMEIPCVQCLCWVHACVNVWLLHGRSCLTQILTGGPSTFASLVLTRCVCVACASLVLRSVCPESVCVGLWCCSTSFPMIILTEPPAFDSSNWAWLQLLRSPSRSPSLPLSIVHQPLPSASADEKATEVSFPLSLSSLCSRVSFWFPLGTGLCVSATVTAWAGDGVLFHYRGMWVCVCAHVCVRERDSPAAAVQWSTSVLLLPLHYSGCSASQLTLLAN